MKVDIDQLSLSKLRTNKRIPKISRGALQQLQQLGQIQPIIVRTMSPGQYEILKHGEIWLGVQRLGLHQVDILIRDDLNDAQAAILVNSTEKTDPITEAENFSQLLGERSYGGITKTAVLFGVSRSYVSHSLRLLTLPFAVQEALKMGALKAGHGKALLALDDSQIQVQLAIRSIKNKDSVRNLERQVQSIKTGKGRAGTFKEPSIHVLSVQDKYSKRLNCEVQLDEQKGKLIINYYQDLEILEGILKRIH